jgi:hypothetical protein
MIHSFFKFISSISLLVGFASSGLLAQNSDHLSMSLIFKDSIVYVNATYQVLSDERVDSVFFLLNPGFELDTIKAKGLKSYKVTQKKGMPLPFFHLEFNENRDEGEKLSVEFKYKINLSEQNHMKSNWIELNADKLWFPNLEALNNEFTYTVTITDFPKSYRLVTHTDAMVTRQKNQIVIQKDTPWYEVLILAGKNMKEWNYDDKITLIGNEHTPDSTIQSIGSKVKKSIDLLNSTIGGSDPITSFYVVLRNTSRKELGFQFNRKNLIVTGIDFNDYGNLSHEIAHYWWRKANFINEPWMNESFANFSMYMVLQEFDVKDYQRLVVRNRELSKNAIPVVNASLFAADSYNSYYYKGALHLISLEEKIGSEKMKQLLTACVEKNINTTEAFLVELESLTSLGERDFFEDLLKM